MTKNIRNLVGTFIEYLMVTYANKLVALLLVGLSLIPVVLEGNGTVLILMLMFCIPLFFSKRNWILN